MKYDFFHFAAAMEEALELAREIFVIGFTEQFRRAERVRRYVRRGGQMIHAHILSSAETIRQTILGEAEKGIGALQSHRLFICRAAATLLTEFHCDELLYSQ